MDFRIVAANIDALPVPHPQVTFIWKSNWGIGKVIYMLARYSALVDTPWALWRTSHRPTSFRILLLTECA
jgi:hypothetical protein